MNAHSLRILEFDRCLDWLSGYARSEPGRAWLRALRPRPDPGACADDRALFGEALALRRQGTPLPPVQFSALDDALTRAAPARTVLDPEEFLAARTLLEAVATARDFALHARCDGTPALRALGAALDPCPDLLFGIDRTLEAPKATVRDDASPALRKIRARLNSLARSIQERLESLLQHADLADAFQEQFFTIRHGRHVLPVRREARGRVPGIIHDQSNSGGTLFVEPAAVVESGNELELLRLDERDEIRRILTALTTVLRDHIPALRANAAQLCRFDAAGAIGAWGAEYDCVCPDLGDTPRLCNARHPLLEHRLREDGKADRLVPLDLDLPDGCNVVAITGSNTGGKTVALKTIGLLTLLAQAGLPIPAAPGTRIRCFADVQADIGDEQSIEQSLSTFSAHVGNIGAALATAATAPTLVLLDELGAGTDPVEGAALGCAILDALSEAPGLTLATTHLGAVKGHVHTHPRMANASMLFDVETLQPQYRLRMGQAGASYALAIAERRGLPAGLIAAARQFMTDQERRMEGLLAELDARQVRLSRQVQEAAQARDAAVADQQRAQADRDRIARELKERNKERRRLMREAQTEAAALLERTRREVEQVLARARQAPPREEARALRREIDTRQQAAAAALARTRETPEQPLAPADVQVGARVWIEALRDDGTVTAVAEGGARATVQVGGLRFEARRTDLARARRGRCPSAPPPPPPSSTLASPPPAASAAPASELNLVGLRVADAMDRLDVYLDGAIRAELPQVRIVHGHGTGALRAAVHEYLRKAGISTFRPGEPGRDPGGAGVTLVTL